MNFLRKQFLSANESDTLTKNDPAFEKPIAEALLNLYFGKCTWTCEKISQQINQDNEDEWPIFESWNLLTGIYQSKSDEGGFLELRYYHGKLMTYELWTGDENWELTEEGIRSAENMIEADQELMELYQNPS